MRRLVIGLVAASLVPSAVACRDTAPTPRAERVDAPLPFIEAPADSAPAPLQGAADPFIAAAALLPADADLVVSARWDTLFLDLIVRGAGLFPNRKDAPDLRRELVATARRILGVDLTGLTDLTAFTMADEPGVHAVVLSGRFGTARPASAPVDVAGTATWTVSDRLSLAAVGPHLVLGTPDGVARVLEVHAGRRPPLLGSAAGLVTTRLRGLVGAPRRPLVASAASPAFTSRLPAVGLEGLEGLALSVGSDGLFQLAMTGSDETIASAEDNLESLTGFAREAVTELTSDARSQADLREALTGHVMAHTVTHLLDAITVTRKGPALHLRADTGMSGGAFVAFIVASLMPTAIQHMRRTKTTEATDQIDRIYKGAAVYYTTPRVDADGKRLPCAFPPSVDPTPTGSPCDHPDKKYPVDAAAWKQPGWVASYFEMTEPHYFRYSIESSGVGVDAELTIRAHADLDCDGVWSTFQRTTFGDPSSGDGLGDCTLTGSSAFYVENETE